MLYEIMEKTTDWKVGEKTLMKILIKNGATREEAAKYLADTKDIRRWSYNRGVCVFAGVATVVFVGIPLVKGTIEYIQWHALRKRTEKIMEKIGKELEKTEADAK